jgi:hypothetical protein
LSRLSPGAAGLKFGGERHSVTGSLVQDSVTAGGALRQFGDLRLGRFQAVYGHDPIGAVFAEPENIEGVFHDSPPDKEFLTGPGP